MPSTRNFGRVTIHLGAEHRDGKCENCGTPTENLEVEFVDAAGRTRKAKRPICPKCGGKGRLVVRQVSVQAPDPPLCLSPKCLADYFKESLFYVLLSSYHSRRVAYAEANRHKKILDRYRTGEPSPKTLWQAIHANIKLTCPVCRKFNIDPLGG